MVNQEVKNLKMPGSQPCFFTEKRRTPYRSGRLIAEKKNFMHKKMEHTGFEPVTS